MRIERCFALRGILTTCLGVVTTVLVVSRTSAVPRYNDYCIECHGSFTDGTSPKGTLFPQNSKHHMHRSSQYMNTDCNLCHSTGDMNNPFIGVSNGTANNPGLGCTGCHGRDYGGAIGSSGVGLRALHALNGITTCGFCHMEDPPPLPESVLPVYYGTPDTDAGEPCNEGGLENWSIGDLVGLDNDGDGFYDGNDADCGVLGDINCDDTLDTADIGVFVLALIDPEGHQALHGECDILKVDFDNNGEVNGLDAQGFIDALIG